MGGKRKVSVVRWSALWRSNSSVSGESQHLLFENLLPVLFVTRREASEYIKSHFAYCKRADLRAEPHGWRMPIPVRVTVELVERRLSRRKRVRRGEG